MSVIGVVKKLLVVGVIKDMIVIRVVKSVPLCVVVVVPMTSMQSCRRMLLSSD